MLRDLGLCWVASDMQQSGSPQNFCTSGTSVKGSLLQHVDYFKSNLSPLKEKLLQKLDAIP